MMLSSSSTLATATFLVLLITTTPATAQDASQQVLTLPFFGYDGQIIDASIISVSNQQTTLALACPTDTDSNDCGLFPFQTLTVGPSTYNMYMSDEGFTGTQECTTYGTTSALCTESAAGDEANFPGVSTATYEGTDIVMFPVTVTAGAALLSGGGDSTAAATTTGPSSTTAASSSGGSGSSGTAAITSAPSSSGAVTGSASGSSAVAPSASTGAAVGHASAMGGAAGVVGAAAGLLGYLLV